MPPKPYKTYSQLKSTEILNVFKLLNVSSAKIDSQIEGRSSKKKLIELLKKITGTDNLQYDVENNKILNDVKLKDEYKHLQRSNGDDPQGMSEVQTEAASTAEEADSKKYDELLQDMDEEQREEALLTIQKVLRGKHERENLKTKKQAIDTIKSVISSAVERKNLGKMKTKKELKEMLEEYKKSKQYEEAIKKHEKEQEEFNERQKKMEEKQREEALLTIQKVSRGKQERENLKEKKKAQREYDEEVKQYGKTPRNLRGDLPKPKRTDIVPIDPKSIIPEEEEKEENQYKRIRRKNLGDIGDGDVKTEKKKLNTHVEATVPLSDIRKALEKQKQRLKIRPAKITYHHLGKSMAKEISQLI